MVLPANWNRFCEHYLILEDLDISLDISRIGFSDTFFAEMQEHCQTALADMQELEAGAIANPDEQRMVGHYWLRNPAIAPSGTIKKAILQSQTQIQKLSAAIHDGTIKGSGGKPFTQVVLIGIGGSALGPQLLADYFESPACKMQLHSIDNTDPDGMERLFSKLSDCLDQTLVLVVSKSGGTVETRNGYLVAEAVFESKGLRFAQHAIAITCENSALDSIAKDGGWITQTYLWDWVGGRTSIFSAVGLLPAALLGIDIKAFLSGAAKMDVHTREAELMKNPALLLALMWFWAGEGQGNKNMIVLPYKDRLLLFSRYLQQLVMESIGKEKDLSGGLVYQGLSVFGNKGSTDQHAFVQQLRDGRRDFFVTFIEVLQRCMTNEFDVDGVAVEQDQSCADFLQGFYLGTRKALAEEERESITITLSHLNEESLGALIALYERAVGYYASFINVNAYHQPGVEAGKRAAKNVIALQRKILEALSKRSSPGSAQELAEEIGEEGEVETVFKILCSLTHNTNVSVRSDTELHPRTARFYQA